MNATMRTSTVAAFAAGATRPVATSGRDKLAAALRAGNWTEAANLAAQAHSALADERWAAARLTVACRVAAVFGPDARIDWSHQVWTDAVARLEAGQ